MKRITALALALFMVANLVVCSGFILRDKEADENKPANEEETEASPFWEQEVGHIIDDFGDYTFWGYAEGKTQSFVEFDSSTDNNYADIGIIAVPADIALTDDSITAPVFTFNFTYSDLDENVDNIFSSSSITFKIKVLNKEYEALLIEGQGSYSLIDYGDNEELYDKFVEELEAGNYVNCVVVSGDTKIQFYISGEGYSDAMKEVDDYNELDAWLASRMINSARKK